ncbi:F-box/WD repeat-containing protein 10 [Dunckerocampus dactyliophorus]|uniref:F-box/WD repeat-containing protein 10 n=1 Tax=Dunckerocampus dactyliophorus TaxID=161453 RepID=UPI0024073A83|nr:F-box/WD repeat-containing protein 10 [Dunckerocampus dactyliophorus]
METPCSMCPCCLFASRGAEHTQDLWKLSDEPRRRFIVGVLLRCRSIPVLENIQTSLRLTSWNLLNYSRSKRQTLPEFYARLDKKAQPPPLVQDIWDWFDRSQDWVQIRYLCQLLLQCDPELLSMAKHLIGVVVVRLKQQLEAKSVGSKEHDHASEKDSADPTLTPTPRPSKSTSGLSRCRDFISCLPADLSKRILAMLDEQTLKRCMKVCKYWKHLAGETMEEIRFRKAYLEQVEAMMKRYKGIQFVDPSYARIVDILVPAEDHEEEAGKALKDWPFQAAYANIRTTTLRMEERNMYCGAYFSSVLLDEEDPHRVVDYRGGPFLSTASKDRTVRLFYVATEAKHVALMKGHVGSIRVVLLCPERELVITASCDSSIRCWSVRTDQCVLVLYGHSSTVNCLDIHADRLVSGAKDCTVKVWSLQTEKHLEEFNFKHRKSVRCVKITATTVFSSCDRGVIKLWDAEKATLLRVIDAHRCAVRCMFVDRWHLLTADINGQVMAWSSRFHTKGCLMTFSHPKEVKSLTLVFLRVITGCADGKIRVFNFLTGECLRTIMVEAETGRIMSMHFSENNILVNATSCVKIYHFAKVFWEYAEPAEAKEDAQEGPSSSAGAQVAVPTHHALKIREPEQRRRPPNCSTSRGRDELSGNNANMQPKSQNSKPPNATKRLPDGTHAGGKASRKTT